MSRRGRCRCGTILVFELTAQGYKVRCSVCKAVVRLRADDKVPPPQPPRATPPPRVTPPPPPPLSSFSATDFNTEELPLELGGLEESHLGEPSAPVAMVEMEVYQEPKPAARNSLWILLGLAFVGLALAAGSVVLVMSKPS